MKTSENQRLVFLSFLMGVKKNIGLKWVKVEAALGGVLLKNVLKNFANLQEDTCAGVSCLISL